MYYDINRPLSYAQIFNLVFGGRGIGKTYGWKEKAINDFLKKRKQFGYIRRYETEMNLVKDNLFNDILLNGRFDIKMKLVGNEWLINDEVAGYAFVLSKAKDYKSSSFPLVSNLLFDEFLIDGGKSGAGGYLKREPFKLLDLYETIARMRDDVIMFMMSNSVSAVNPYFLEWDINLKENKEFTVQNGMLIQIAKSDTDFVEAKNKTKFGQIARKLGYAEYAVDNKFIFDDPIMKQKKGKNARFYCVFVWKKKKYGFWFDYSSGYYILSNDYDPLSQLIFTLDKDSINGTIIYLKNYSSHPYFKKLRDALTSGFLFYESEKIQHELKSMIVLLY